MGLRWSTYLDMKKGEIFFGKKNSEAIHPIIFLSDINDDLFLGAMLTSSVLFEDNILMDVSHFETHDHSGQEYKLRFKNTHLVKARLLKKREWAPFRKIGELTTEGIYFVETYIHTTQEMLWEDYLNLNN